MAAALSTEVPPNFITSIAPPASIEIAPGLQEFGVQESSAGRAANRVVGQHGKFPVEDAARPQTSDGCGHASTAVHVEARLRTVWAGEVDDGLLGRARKLQFLGHAAEFIPGGDD